MATEQPRRLTYTRRDLISYHSDVSVLIKELITRITDTSEMNSGRIFLSIVEGLVDVANYASDQSFLELILETARQRKVILRCSYMLGYHPSPVSPASVDLTFSMLTGVAPAGGKAIPIYTRCQSTESPYVEFITIEATSIPEGESSVSGIPAVQGILVTNDVLTGSADGKANQKYTLSNAKTPHNLVQIAVDGVSWSWVDDFTDSDEESLHFRLEFDEDDYTSVVFGDGEFGKIPGSGSQILATYVRTDAENGNSGAGTITKILGALASEVGVTNPEKASGGAVSETNESIKRNAPGYRSAFDLAVTHSDYIAISTAVGGVYKAFCSSREGARTDIYIMPEGGGVASSYLLGLVQDALDEAKLDGAQPFAQSLNLAGVIISVNIVTFDSRVAKATVRKKVIDETLAKLDYRQLTKGRAFTQSDLSGIYESLNGGTLVDYADFKILTRVPRVVKSNLSAPDVVGRVIAGSTAGYDTWLLSAISTTQFAVSKNGVPQAQQGTVATEYVSSDGEVTFTLGESGDTFVVGDTWLFKTSKYADNIVIDSDEYMYLDRSSDLIVSVFFPGEYDITTKSGVD